MRLEAHLTTGDLQDVLFQLTPLAVALDPTSPQRQLSVKPPASVELIEGRGLRIVTEVQLQWALIGVRFPVTLRRVAVLLQPAIDLLGREPVVLLRPYIEEADVSALPGFLGDVVLARVNDALERPEARIMWRFMETLDFRFALPPQIQPAYAVRLFARNADVRVGKDSLRLAIDWGLTADADAQTLSSD
jgi:hypothetical protein